MDKIPISKNQQGRKRTTGLGRKREKERKEGQKDGRTDGLTDKRTDRDIYHSMVYSPAHTKSQFKPQYHKEKKFSSVNSKATMVSELLYVTLFIRAYKIQKYPMGSHAKLNDVILKRL